MHVIRLYFEAKEYMQTGKITLPNPRVDLLIAIRLAKYRRSEIEEMGKELRAETHSAQKSSPLPDAVDHEAISRLVTEVYVGFWGSQK